MQLKDLQPQSLGIKGAITAMYYQGDVIYVDKHRQLRRYAANHQVMADNIRVRSFEQSLLQHDKLYYIATKAGASMLFAYDLGTGEQSAVELDGAAPTRMAVIDDKIFIRVREVLRPKLMVGVVSPK
jgi:hypothetical protein